MKGKPERYQINLRLNKETKREIKDVSGILKKPATQMLLEGWGLFKKENDRVIHRKN